MEKLTRQQKYRLRKKGEAIPLGKPGPKKGYKQSQEHIEKRKRFEENHPNWKGDKVSEKGGRTRALRKFKDIGPCHFCGNQKSERHHIDGNTANNNNKNILPVCRRCHMMSDGRLYEFKRLARENQPKAVASRWNKTLLSG